MSPQSVPAQPEVNLNNSPSPPVKPDPQFVDIRDKLECTEAELANARIEKNALEIASHEKEQRIAQLEQQISSLSADQAQIKALQSQLESATRQVDAAEQEKRLLADKIQVAQDRFNKPKPRAHPAASGIPGIRGRVLAVNRSYNFVVLDLGAREGVESNTEMVVMRGSTYIGKIRVSSVEPATTIGDIVITSLAHGVRVQQGDTVVYGGTNF